MASTELRVKELLRERGWTTKVLAEKTGMSESYLTHIKNGTRRWNEDALKKLSVAFDANPVDLFLHRRPRTDSVETSVKVPDSSVVDLALSVVPVMGDLPSNPSPYNNQLMQVTTGYRDVFVPIFNTGDEGIFCLSVENNLMAPKFVKGDLLVISPEKGVNSGDIVAVEFGDESPTKTIMQISYVDEFIVLESVNHKQQPVALIKGKDQLRIIGKVIFRYQKVG